MNAKTPSFSLTAIADGRKRFWTLTGARIRWLLIITLVWLAPTAARGEVTLIAGGRALGEVIVDSRGSHAVDARSMEDAANWLVDTLTAASGVALPIRRADAKTEGVPAIILKLSDAPVTETVADPLDSSREAFAVVTRKDQIDVIGRSGVGVRHGVAALLRHLGFRYFAPSPVWHHIPELKNVSIDFNTADSPSLRFRRIWYAYGVPGEDLKSLSDNYQRWVWANQLSLQNTVQCGHSYGNIVGRNQDVFDRHPEFFALLSDGSRDVQRNINARKFCFSNPELLRVVAEDRVQLLRENKKLNPDMKMVSVDPSDGQGTCHCDSCVALGTTTDRVFHLANAVARAIRAEDPDAWVGLYAYSSHRLPPTIDIEPNVYVQVAMGFNRTQYSFTELVELWSKKVSAIGLREYYGVEAWDWGLPGRMRGGQVDYHRQWIPYYAKRNLDAVNAETNANWGGQTLGLYVAARLMWDPQRDTAAEQGEFFDLCFREAATPIRRLYERFDQSPPLRSSSLTPLFQDVELAWQLAKSESVRARLRDLMAYLVYVAEFRKFDLVRSRQPSRNDEYYRALLPLMNYVWRIRHRDMVHYYALARRLCNGLPVQDGRDEYWFARKDKPPIWMNGEDHSDKEIVSMFTQWHQRLQNDDDPSIAFSRYLDPLEAEGEDVGPSTIAGSSVSESPQPGLAKFRGPLLGYLLATKPKSVRMGIAPSSREAKITVSVGGRKPPLFQQTYRSSESFREVVFQLPRANEYQVLLEGDFALRVGPEVPFVYEASLARPAWVDYSGPNYFFVPSGTTEIYADANPRLSIFAPGNSQRVDISRFTRKVGTDYSVVAVPPGADGQVWHTSNQTRGTFSLLNVPPLLSLHRDRLLRPREVQEASK